jgi:hypothetical protein
MLSEMITLGTENALNNFSLSTFMVAKVMASPTGTRPQALQKESTHRNIMLFPDFLHGNFHM